MNESVLALMCVEGIGPRIYKNLIQTFGSAREVFQQDKTTLKRLSFLSGEMAENIAGKKYGDILDLQLKWMEKHHAFYVTQDDKAYPEVLKHIYDAPPVLMCFGNFKKDDQIAFAVVGSRYPDDYGKLMTEHIATGIAKRQISIVSGMAKGIDSIAHQCALKEGSRTIAVLGTSLDRIYPAENRRMFHQICEKGVVCTETLIGQKLAPGNFIRRNRIISGLSRGVIVTQAGTKSGALVTALAANEQNRDVFAVPGDCFKGKHTGCHRLIRLGAKIVEHAEDVLNEYPFLNERLAPQRDWIIDSSAERDLSRQEQDIIALLDKEGVHIDMLIAKSRLTRPELMSALLNLEIKGYIKVRPGDYYVRNI
ncbi:MAG: DNA-processing protein DprA [FCB group bacterium]|nr:DNA-processing protein DprA [FCB group bacterium]